MDRHMRLSRATTDSRTRARPRASHVPVTAGRAVSREITGGTDPLADERRLRESGGPEDNATYHCGCGLVFSAPVSTGVTCPHCGTGQAW